MDCSSRKELRFSSWSENCRCSELRHRGCRLGIAYPEITEMQARAVFAAVALKFWPEAKLR